MKKVILTNLEKHIHVTSTTRSTMNGKNRPKKI